ncbi:leucine-rich repeat domain-containing protein, partial [Kordia jejudonensis]|uniref:leucine-rich repeat domain-containing protein n=1 Tax=Kordia jejudonensis TaxID=1348245 RepID=UPI00062945E1
MRLKLLLTFLIFTNIFWIHKTVAQPVNDNFANAISVTCGNNYTATTITATIDEDNAPDATTPQAVDLDAPNIWYSYTGSGTPETVTLDLCASGYDTSYLVYTGTSGNLTLVAANDFNDAVCGPGFRSYGTFESDGTTTYYITITGYNSTDTGTVDMNVSCVPNVATPNTIALAVPIVPSVAGTGCPSSGYTFDLDFTNSGTTDSGLGGCLNGDFEGIDQFFTWTATTNGLKYSTPSFVGRAGMIIRNATAPYEIIDCSKALDNNDGIFTGWNVGDNLIIQIYKSEGFSGIADARFCLEEKSFSTPNNDLPAGAIPIVPGLAGSDCTITTNNQTLFLNTNTYTTTDSGMDTCVGNDTGVDQFFTWTATSGGLLWGQNPDNIGISVRSTTGVEYGCIVTNQGDPVKLSGWEIGEDLIIQLFNYENYHYDALTFCLREYETPTNNILSGATPITPTALADDCTETTLFFSSDGTTDSGLDGTCNGANTGYDQFFTWTATTNALSWTGLTENPGIIIRDTAGNEITCADTIAPDNTILSGWDVGDELIIQIYDWVFIINSGTAAGNVEDSYRDISFCLKEHQITIPGQTFVPDDNFEQYLINQGYDTILDNYVTTANINSITGIDVSNDNIADLTGIEDFTALRTLYASNNQLTSIDITQNVALEDFRINNNNISTLNITQNVLIRKLDIYYNQITSLDLTQNAALEDIEAWNNQLTSIDVSQNLMLRELEINNNNQVSSVDVTANTNLETLNVGFTQISSIDLSNNLMLDNLSIVNCPITTINLSINLALERLNIAGSQLTTLDASNNTNLISFLCQDSSLLTSVNMQNGNNSNLSFFLATNTPNLACVQVDDVAYSTANWTNVDTGINFSTDCGFLENDTCVNAINVPVCDGTCNNVVSATMVNATNSNSLQCFGNNANFTDVWFSFVATETTHEIKLQNLIGSPSFLWHAVIDAQAYTCGN